MKFIIYAKFVCEDILSENGQLVFSLLKAFAQSDSRVVLFNNLGLYKFERIGGVD